VPYALRIYRFMDFPRDFLRVSLTIAQTSVVYSYFPGFGNKRLSGFRKIPTLFPIEMPYQPAYIANIRAYLPTYLWLDRRYLLLIVGRHLMF
jgi:hypothetical protein